MIAGQHTAGGRHAQLKVAGREPGLQLLIVNRTHTAVTVHTPKEGSEPGVGACQQCWRLRGSYLLLWPAGLPFMIDAYRLSYTWAGTSLALKGRAGCAQTGSKQVTCSQVLHTCSTQQSVERSCAAVSCLVPDCRLLQGVWHARLFFVSKVLLRTSEQKEAMYRPQLL